MRVSTLGAGDPEIVVAGAIHGDEPCGAKAINRFLDEQHDIRRPVKLIIVNEPALERNQRYIDVDLNRVLPGDPNSDAYEERLAHDFVKEVCGCTGLGLHSTVSYDRPFGAVANLNARKRNTFEALRHVNDVMDTTAVSNGRRCVDLPWYVDVEAGKQGTDAAANYAYDCLIDFLRFTDVLPGDAPATPVNIYRVFDLVWKEDGADYTFLRENFELVKEGEVYATRNSEDLVAERDFWPILMSDHGHEELFGYRGILEDPPQSLATD